MTTAPVAIPTLRTERLVLRAPRRADFDAYAAFYVSERAGAGTPTRRAAWKSFAKEIVDWCLTGIGHWTLVRDDGAAVGFAGLSWPDFYPEPEIGWAVYDGHEGQGYATEAGHAMLGWARGRLPSLVSYIGADNIRSIRVAERLGARLDAGATRPEARVPVRVYRHWGPVGGGGSR